MSPNTAEEWKYPGKPNTFKAIKHDLKSHQVISVEVSFRDRDRTICQKY